MNHKRKMFLIALLVWYTSFSLVMSIAPANRQFWLAANILPTVLVMALVLTHRLKRPNIVGCRRPVHGNTSSCWPSGAK